MASNIFVRPKTMPGWLQAIVSVNPVSHALTARRDPMDGHPATAGADRLRAPLNRALAVAFTLATTRLYRKHR